MTMVLLDLLAPWLGGAGVLAALALAGRAWIRNRERIAASAEAERLRYAAHRTAASAELAARHAEAEARTKRAAEERRAERAMKLARKDIRAAELALLERTRAPWPPED